MTARNVTSELDMAGLAEVLFVANTPTYLYKNFRRSTSVEVFAREHSVQELITVFESLAVRKELGIEDYVCIYAIYIGLFFKEYPDILTAFLILDKYVFKWSKELKHIILANAKSEIVVTKNIEPYITVKEEAI